MLEERGAPRRAEAGDVVERRGRHALAALPAVLGDREAVRLVADALEQVQALGGTLEDDGVLLPRQPDLLEPLGEAAQRDVVDAEVGQGARRGGDLRRAAVDDDEVRRVREARAPVHGRVGVDLAAARHVARRLRGTLRPARRGVGPVGDVVRLEVQLDLARARAVGQVALEAARDHLVHRRRVVGRAVAVRAADREVPVLALAREPVLEDHHRGDLVRALVVRDVVALDAQRRRLELERLLDLAQRLAAGREVARAPRAVQRERVLRVGADRRGELLLVAALRHPDVDPRAPQPGEPRGDLVGVRRQDGHEDLARHGVAREVAPGARPGVRRHGLLRRAVHLLEQVLDELGVRDVLDLLDDPAALTPDATAAHVEHLDGRLELVPHEREHVRVGAVAEHDRVLLRRALERGDVVAQPCRGLVLHRGGGLVHLALEPAHEPLRVARHEVAEVLGERLVVLGRDAPDARRRALVDVAEQARPARLVGALEDPRRARAHGEHPQQEVERLADRPRVAVGPEVPRAGPLRAAHHLGARELLAHRHREVRVRLVVAVLDVEPRVELLDPRVLERERLDLGADDRPLDRRGRRDHRLGAVVQVRDVLEVVRQARAQVLGLADVDHTAVLVAEPVDARRGGDLPRRRAVRRGICHVLQPRSGHRRRWLGCGATRGRGTTDAVARDGVV